MAPSFNNTDRVVLLYNTTITVHIALSHGKLPNWPELLGIHLFISAVTWFVSSRDVRWLHRWYPLILLLWFYPETGMLRHSVIPTGLDGSLILWETALFPQRFYFTVPLGLSVPSLEFLHGAYFSFFFLLWIPAMIAHTKHRESVGEYIFVLMITLFVHFWIAILFPASGPTSLRGQVIPPGFLFIPLMNFLYATMDQGGAAFPSTHAAASIIATSYGIRFFPELRIVFLLWLFVILISTVLCTFNYVIDAISGVITGTLFLVWGKKIDARIDH